MKASLFGALCIAAIGCGSRTPQAPSVQEQTTVTANRLTTEPEPTPTDGDNPGNYRSDERADEPAIDEAEKEEDVDTSNLLRMLTEREQAR